MRKSRIAACLIFLLIFVAVLGFEASIFEPVNEITKQVVVERRPMTQYQIFGWWVMASGVAGFIGLLLGVATILIGEDK